MKLNVFYYVKNTEDYFYPFENRDKNTVMVIGNFADSGEWYVDKMSNHYSLWPDSQIIRAAGIKLKTDLIRFIFGTIFEKELRELK